MLDRWPKLAGRFLVVLYPISREPGCPGALWSRVVVCGAEGTVGNNILAINRVLIDKNESTNKYAKGYGT